MAVMPENIYDEKKMKDNTQHFFPRQTEFVYGEYLHGGRRSRVERRMMKGSLDS